MSKKDALEAARVAAELSIRVLKANEILWMDAWRAAPNPFIAIKNYRSEAERKKRKPIIDAWLAATSTYESMKPKRSESA